MYPRTRDITEAPPVSSKLAGPERLPMTNHVTAQVTLKAWLRTHVTITISRGNK